MAGLLIDSDAFLLLAGADSLDRAVQLIGCLPQETFRLYPLPHMIGRSAKLRQRYSAETRDRARLATDRFQGIGKRPSDKLLQRLIGVQDIDEGEALLYGILAEEEDYLLASGDKRAMIALCAEPSLKDIREAVAGRVVCLESILRRMALEDGVQAMSVKFAGVVTSHRTLQILLSPGNCETIGVFLQGVDSYITDLKGHLDSGFLREI